MRIKFQPIPPISKNNAINDLYEFDIPYLLFLQKNASNQIPIINYIQSYSDKCRYNLHIIKGTLPFINRNLKAVKEEFYFIEIETLFKLPFNFILFNEGFANYWGKDYDIHTIKPKLIVAGNEEKNLAIAGFRSLASSFLRKIYDKIGEENGLVIIKKGHKFIVSFRGKNMNEKAVDYVIENLSNAVYEMVKITQVYGQYELPEIDYKVPVNIGQQYKLKKQRNFMKKRKVSIERNYW